MYIDAEQGVELEKKRINTYADAFRNQFSGDATTMQASRETPATAATRP